MRNVSRDQVVANFEELVRENQIKTAVELLATADAEDQLIIVEESNPHLLETLLLALSNEERASVLDQLTKEVRESLLGVLPDDARAPAVADTTQAINRFLATRLTEEFEDAGLSAKLTGARIRATGPLSPRRSDFTIVDGRLVESTPLDGVITLFANPSLQEQRALIEAYEIDEHTLASALDPDEISRIEFDEETQEAFIVWTRPQRRATHPELLGLASMGFFLRPDHLTIVTEDEAPLLRAGDRADSLRNLVLRVMASTVNEFIVELKTIKRASQEIGHRLSRAIENRELLKMFDLSEGLVYHINALDANGGVLRRMRALAPRLGLDEADNEFLEDIIVDNTQCVRQGQTFSTILAGLMDARGSLINNNMNVLLKNLTIINIVFLPLGIIASVGGMSEYSVWLDDYSIDWREGYVAFAVGVVVIGLILLKGVRYWIDRMFSST